MGTYQCICGEIFDKPQFFNGHKQGCKIHLLNKYGSLKRYYDIKNRSSKIAAQTRIRNNQKKRSDNLAHWIQEQHKCEKCGKIMTEKYGSGRFCSKSCANSHVRSEESKEKTSKSMKKSGLHGAALRSHLNRIEACQNLDDELNRTCIVCGNQIPLSASKIRKTCSDECKKQLLRKHAIDRHLGGPSKVSSYGKRGSYKGIHCDSTYELGFLVYCIDHDINIIRNNKSFQYEYNQKIHNYYPDFYLPDYNIFIEIKGRNIGPVQEKLNCVTASGNLVKILYYDDLKFCFDYVSSEYNLTYSASRNTFYKLYD